MNEIITTDLADFGSSEKATAGELLSALNTDKDLTHFLGDGVKLYLNKNSGFVFLSDEDYNTAMIDDEGHLRDFHSCPICGSEGFLEDLHDGVEELDSECQEWFDNLVEVIAED